MEYQHEWLYELVVVNPSRNGISEITPSNVLAVVEDLLQ